jgi:hypothetical protein
MGKNETNDVEIGREAFSEYDELIGTEVSVA